jgi:hypothetical protein
LEKEFPTPSAFVFKELAARDRVTLRKSLRNGGLRESEEMRCDRDRDTLFSFGSSQRKFIGRGKMFHFVHFPSKLMTWS